MASAAPAARPAKKRKTAPKRPRKTAPKKGPLLFDGPDWSFDALNRTYDAIEDIALKDLKLDIYPNQLEVISSEQMLDAYSSIGMPLMYRHWSYGKSFLREERQYRKGLRGLAYEIVINSNPCISYNMEENTMAMQTLVMAHAAFGHNHFFKNNHLFQMWTDAEGILDYLEYARNFVADCESRHGEFEVERILDSAHALMSHGVFRYERPARPSLKEEKARHEERLAQEEADVNYLWVALERNGKGGGRSTSNDDHASDLRLPEENLLYFLEQYSPILPNWQRELLRIVRNISQYFYPQRQTKVMNEGCATFCHYYICNELHRRGQISDGALLEILHSHTSVVTQPEFDDPRYSGINPYALGYAMMDDIKRMVTDPTDEDREWFPSLAGKEDWRAVLKDVWANYRDESFIQQFLSPRLIRSFGFFNIADKETSSHYRVTDIQDERGYRSIREALAQSYDPSVMDPDIQVVDVDLLGDRTLRLACNSVRGARLNERDADEVLTHVARLWGYDVTLEEPGASTPVRRAAPVAR
ncbi:MAG: SpoVR family protein [Pseudomonadota bacterium]